MPFEKAMDEIAQADVVVEEAIGDIRFVTIQNASEKSSMVISGLGTCVKLIPLL